jgi:hypothetical protein
MTDQTNPERGTEQPSTELPIPTLETPSTTNPSSVDTDAIAEQVAEKIRREIRQAQSTRDKEISAANKKLAIGDLSELEALGVTIPENVKNEYRFRQLESQRTAENPPSQQTPSPGNGAALTAQDVSEAVKQFNLDANNADVIEALRGTYRNRDHFEATLAKLAIAKTNKPSPSAAESGSLASTSVTRPDDVKSVTDEYEARLAKIPRGNTIAVSNLKAEMRKKAREKGFILNI